jgi:hypothetical protein
VGGAGGNHDRSDVFTVDSLCNHSRSALWVCKRAILTAGIILFNRVTEDLVIQALSKRSERAQYAVSEPRLEVSNCTLDERDIGLDLRGGCWRDRFLFFSLGSIILAILLCLLLLLLVFFRRVNLGHCGGRLFVVVVLHGDAFTALQLRYYPVRGTPAAEFATTL